MDLNRVILIGRLASDPELKYTPSGIAVTQFRLAVNRPMSSEARQNGQEKQADFISIVAWRQSAEYAANYLGKGRLVAVEGRLQVREYVTQDGQKRRDTEVVVDNLKSLDRPKEGAESTGPRYADEGAPDSYAAAAPRPQAAAAPPA
ncbi:MAG: single-strand binding protein, partial [Capsulimonas sp.]|nr:single-strand binding protein [Capsulimonas sp.]